MRNIYAVIIVLSFVIGLAGCQRDVETSTSKKVIATMEAHYTTSAVTVDGHLDEAIWKKATTYRMDLADDRSQGKGNAEEQGLIQLAWDDKYFYVGIRCEDSDIYAEGLKDELRHFELGDLCEIFLKPDEKTWYWELYVTPRSRKTSFFFPGRGRFGLAGNMEYNCGLKVAAVCNGTLDNWRDKDRSWTAEMAMPIKDMNEMGYSFTPETQWRILAARYNYSRYLSCQGAELTMTPKLSVTNYHLHSEYAYLKLVK